MTFLPTRHGRQRRPASAASADLGWFMVTLAAFALLFAVADRGVSAGAVPMAESAVLVAHALLRGDVLLLLVAISFTLPKWRRARRRG